MKQLLSIVALAFLLTSCSSKAYLFTSFREPANEGLRLLGSRDGKHWNDLGQTFIKPAVGSKVMRDPSMVQGPDGTFHLVWTSGWRGDKGFGYASSKDLLHWSEQQFVPVMAQEKDVVNVWAPELFYDADGKQYIIIWASTIPFRFSKGQEEEENNHRMYYTTTRDFKTFTPAKLFLDPGFSVIDAVIIREKKHQYTLVLKDNTRPNRNLKVAHAKAPLGPYSAASEPFSQNFTEGPSVVRLQNEWLVYFDAYKEKIYGAVGTKDFKIFSSRTADVVVPQGHKHGTIVPVKPRTIRKLKAAIEQQQNIANR